MQTNIPTKPTQGFVSSPAATEHERRQVHVHPCGTTGALHRTHHPNGCIPQEQPLTILISLLSCLTLIFKGFAQGPLLGPVVLHNQSCPPSEETPHCLLWACPSCFSLEDPHPMSPKQTHPWYRLARKHRFQGQYPKASSAGPESPTNSLSQLQFTEFIIVVEGALRSNQNDNNSKKLQRVVWKD